MLSIQRFMYSRFFDQSGLGLKPSRKLFCRDKFCHLIPPRLCTFNDHRLAGLDDARPTLAVLWWVVVWWVHALRILLDLHLVELLARLLRRWRALILYCALWWTVDELLVGLVGRLNAYQRRWRVTDVPQMRMIRREVNGLLVRWRRLLLVLVDFALALDVCLFFIA